MDRMNFVLLFFGIYSMAVGLLVRFGKLYFLVRGWTRTNPAHQAAYDAAAMREGIGSIGMGLGFFLAWVLVSLLQIDLQFATLAAILVLLNVIYMAVGAVLKRKRREEQDEDDF